MSPRVRVGVVATVVVAAVAAAGVLLFRPQDPDPQAPVVEASTTTVAAGVASPASASTVVATSVAAGGVTTSSTAAADTPVTSVTTTAPAPAVVDTSTTTTTVAARPVGPRPDFGDVTPTHLWPDEPTGADLGPAGRAVDVWDEVEEFWRWYLAEGHPQAYDFDASSRRELSDVAAEQLGWVHHRFWSETLPRWDRVWYDAWAAEREQQREWLMIAYYPMIYNNPAHGGYQRYWGPTRPGDDGSEGGDKLLPLMDLDVLEAWLAERGYSTDLLADWGLTTHTGLEYTEDGGWQFTLERVVRDSVTYEAYRSELMPDEVPDWLADVAPNPHLDPDAAIWREWVNSVDIEAILGPQAAGGKLGPEPGEYWYQWHPEGFDVSSLADGGIFIDIFSIMPDWWPERLEVPVHDPALFGLGGTISPISPDTGLYYFEVCLWASGGLFGPWSLPHPDLPLASANTTWWIPGWVNAAGVIVEIGEPVNRPCSTRIPRTYFNQYWVRGWERATGFVDPVFIPQDWETLNSRNPQTGTSNDEAHRAQIAVYEKAGLGSWFWRENPNPDGAYHDRLQWSPDRKETAAPDNVGVVIHPVYLWDPEGEPAGYPASARSYPWKWWPISPAAYNEDLHDSFDWQISIAGCHRHDYPYMWTEPGTDIAAAVTADGGPVWAWPGTVHDVTSLVVQKKLAKEVRAAAYAEGLPSSPNSYWPYLAPQHTEWSPYYPPVPCEDFDSGKYEPDWVGGSLSVESYQRWMPTVGIAPHPDWTNPPNRTFK